jgi:hypothetical protein
LCFAASVREQLHASDIASQVLEWRGSASAALYFRAVANLAFDAPQFALAAHLLGVVTRIRSALLQDGVELVTRRGAVGALANLAAGPDLVVEAMFDDALADFLSQLLTRAATYNDDDDADDDDDDADHDELTVALALQLVHNVAQTDALRVRLRPVARAALPLARRLLLDAARLESAWTEKLLAFYAALVESPEFVDVLVELSEPLARAAATAPDSLDGAAHQDDDGRFLAASLLMTSAAHSHLHRDALFRAPAWKAIAFDLLASERILHRKVRPALVKALAELSLSDAHRRRVPRSAATLLRLVDIAVTSPVPDVRVSAAIAVGNVARTDARAAQLIDEHRIVDRLIALVDARREVAPDMRVPHAAVGALTNLVVSPANKARIGRHATLFGHVRKWLELPNALVQFAVVLLLRSLASERRCRSTAAAARPARRARVGGVGRRLRAGRERRHDDGRGRERAAPHADRRREQRQAARHARAVRVRARACASLRATSGGAAAAAAAAATAADEGGDDVERDVSAADIAAVGAAKHFEMLTQTTHVILQAEGLVALQKLVAVDATLTGVAQEAARRVLASDPVARAATSEAAAPTPAHHQADLQMARAAVTAAEELLAANK